MDVPIVSLLLTLLLIVVVVLVVKMIVPMLGLTPEGNRAVYAIIGIILLIWLIGVVMGYAPSIGYYRPSRP